MNEDRQHDDISRIFEELADAVLDEKEEAREALRDAGKNPEKVRSRGRAFIERMKGKARLTRAEAKKAKLDRMRDRLRRHLKRQAGDDPKMALARVMAKESNQGVQAHFHKIEELSDEDAIEMLSEVELVRLLEELEGEKDENNNGT